MKIWSLRVPTRVVLAAVVAFSPTVALAQASSGYCLLSPINDSELSIAGREIVSARLVDLGDQVMQGDLLMQFGAGGLDARIERARAEMEAAERSISRADTLTNVLTDQEIDERRTELAVRSAALRELEMELQRFELRATHDGVVVDVAANVGEVVDGESAVRVVRLDGLLVRIDMPAENIHDYEIGQTLRIVSNGMEATAEVSFVDPLIDLASQSFRLHAILPNNDGSFVAGAVCSLVIEPV